MLSSLPGKFPVLKTTLFSRWSLETLRNLLAITVLLYGRFETQTGFSLMLESKVLTAASTWLCPLNICCGFPGMHMSSRHCLLGLAAAPRLGPVQAGVAMPWGVHSQGWRPKQKANLGLAGPGQTLFMFPLGRKVRKLAFMNELNLACYWLHTQVCPAFSRRFFLGSCWDTNCNGNSCLHILWK